MKPAGIYADKLDGRGARGRPPAGRAPRTNGSERRESAESPLKRVFNCVFAESAGPRGFSLMHIHGDYPGNSAVEL